MFEIAFPWALVLIIVPLLYYWFMPPAKMLLPSALKVPFFNSMHSIVEQRKNKLNRIPVFYLPFLIWIWIVLAISGPRWVGEPQLVERESYNLMMALDLSGSMEIPDMMWRGRPASRLAVVKYAAEQFVKARLGDKIGLILFGSQAYLQTPLTYDRQTILTRLADATVGLAGKTTSIGDAIGLAVKRLDDVPPKGRVIILLTDGANNSGVLDPLKAAELARDDHIKIYTIGLGAESDPGALNNAFLMQNSSADLDEPTLKKIAAMTHGRYFRATDTESLQSIYDTINQLEKVSQTQSSVRPQIEYYPYCVAIALFLNTIWLIVPYLRTSNRFRFKFKKEVFN